MTRIVVDALQVGSELSGVGRLVLGIGSSLRDLPDGVELELRCTAEARALLAPAFPEGTRIRTPLPRSRPRLRRIVYQQLVAPLIDSSHTLLVCPGDQGPLWGRARVLLSINDARRLDRSRPASGLEERFYRAIVPRAARRAAAVVTISEFSRRELERDLGVEVGVVAIHPPPGPLGQEGDDGYALVVGALRPYKGLETVIEALALLDESERVPVRLAGPDEGRSEELRSLAASRGVSRWLEVLGWVSEAELERLYARARLAICPSTYEGYGLPVAESIGHGLPTIASDIPPHREVAGSAALYFASGDPAALAACWRRVLLDQGLRTDLGRRGLERSHALAQLGPTWRDAVLSALATSSERLDRVRE